MGWESSVVVGFYFGPLLQGQTRITKLKVLITHLLFWDVKLTYRVGRESSGLVRLDLGSLF